MTYFEVEVQELGRPRQPDDRYRLSGDDPFLGLHADAPVPQVRVLGLPAGPVIDDDGVAGHVVVDHLAARHARADVLDAAARPQDDSICCGEDHDAVRKPPSVGNADIRAVVAVVGQPT